MIEMRGSQVETMARHAFIRGVHRYARYMYEFLATYRTFSECIIAKADRNYRGIFFSHAFGSPDRSGRKSNEITCTSPHRHRHPPPATATAITATRFSPQRITIVNSIWIVAKLDGTVNYVRMTASSRARICRVDPFERIAIDWFHISFSSFSPNHVRCKENKLIKYCRYGFISPCLPFAFIACFSFGLVADTQSWFFAHRCQRRH